MKPTGGPHASLGFHLWHATLAWKAAIARAVEPYQLTPTQFFVLGAIGWTTKSTGEPPDQRHIAELAGVDPMTTSQVVRALERYRLVRRGDDPSDSRRWRVTLTDIGHRALDGASAKVREVDARFFARLGLDREQLFALFQTLAARE